MNREINMNKSGFIEKLQQETNYSEEQCILINDVLESHFIFRKKNKPKVVADLVEKLAVDEAEADRVYELCMTIIRAEKKAALKHPFGSLKSKEK